MSFAQKMIDAWKKNPPAPEPDPTPVPVPPTPPPTTSQIPFGTSTDFVYGKKSADGGSEIYRNIDGMGVRLLANDGSKIDCKNGYYFIGKGLIDGQGAFKVERLANGAAVISARDFTSPSSGLHYQFAGWTVHTSGSALVKVNPLPLAKGELKETLRGYWATVKGVK